LLRLALKNRQKHFAVEGLGQFGASVAKTFDSEYSHALD